MKEILVLLNQYLIETSISFEIELTFTIFSNWINSTSIHRNRNETNQLYKTPTILIFVFQLHG